MSTQFTFGFFPHLHLCTAGKAPWRVTVAAFQFLHAHSHVCACVFGCQTYYTTGICRNFEHSSQKTVLSGNILMRRKTVYLCRHIARDFERVNRKRINEVLLYLHTTGHCKTMSTTIEFHIFERQWPWTSVSTAQCWLSTINIMASFSSFVYDKDLIAASSRFQTLLSGF